jgi:putative DNA primase/helicase
MDYETLSEQDLEEMDIQPPLPPWLHITEKGTAKVNEVAFCDEFLHNRSLKCIVGAFRDIHGEVDEEEIKHEIAQILMEHVSEGICTKVKNITGTLKLKCYSEPPQLREDEIHLLNGVLNINGEFADVQRFCTNRLNVDYDRAAPPPETFISFLSDLLEPDDITTLQEYLGYLLIPSTRGQAMLSIIGNGGEGKSVLGTVVKEIFGSSMVEGSFRRIETDRFFRANLKDKLVFVDDDLQLEALPSTGYIKSLITVQIPTDIEFKGKQSYCEKLYARFLCFGNGTIKSLYPAIIDRLGEMSGFNMLADIGNGTLNILYLNGGKAVESKCFTEKQGVNQCVIAAANAVMDSMGTKIDDNIIETILRTDTADIAPKYRDIVVAVARKYAVEIFETLRKYEYNPDLMRLYIVGGGGCIVRNFGEYAHDRVTIIPDLCATAKGYEAIALATLRKELYG